MGNKKKSNGIADLYQNRRLIWKLAKNDFKKKYAGSYMGALWALVQPVVTIALYYVVFEYFMPGSRTADVNFVLFLTSGLVPWFFFSEAWNNGTNALREYDYLVKKVVFKISILPVIKVTAATFVHAFFICILLVVGSIYGYYPSIYSIQILYYSFCLYILVLALSYATSAIVVFFKDLSQIITIVLQIGMWATPIMWPISRLGDSTLGKIIRLNPMYYVVEGYRGSVYRKEWFFQNIYETLYFWGATLVLFAIGVTVFKRLKVHFADVL